MTSNGTTILPADGMIICLVKVHSLSKFIHTMYIISIKFNLFENLFTSVHIHVQDQRIHGNKMKIKYVLLKILRSKDLTLKDCIGSLLFFIHTDFFNPFTYAFWECSRIVWGLGPHEETVRTNTIQWPAIFILQKN